METPDVTSAAGSAQPQQPPPSPPPPPPPKDMSHHYSDVTKARVPSKMKEFYRFFAIPGIGQLAGGLPHPSYFPFDTLEAQTAKSDRWPPRADDDASPSSSPSSGSGSSTSINGSGFLASKLAKTTISSPFSPSSSSSPPKQQQQKQKQPAAASHIVVPHDSETADPFKRIDLATALQYGQANGYPPLLSFVRQFTRECLHPNVPYAGGPEVIFTVGSTDGMAKVLEVFVNNWVPGKSDPRDRPGLLTEVFMYTNVLGQAQPRGVQVVPIEMDDVGMRPYGPGGLEDVLANWDESKGKRPHLMYTVTMGHNPTGGVLPLERRREIYAICSEYDVIIVEDDPYWYLQFPSAEVEEARARNLPLPSPPPPRGPEPAGALAKKSGYPFLDSLAPSFLSIDVDGRVVRLDTFSKTVAPGCRMGWITAAPEVVERVLRINETSTQQPSGFVQVVVAEAIMGPQPEAALAAFGRCRTPRDRRAFAGWRVGGWVRWLEGLRGEYERRMNAMCAVLEEGAWQLKQSTPLRPADADWGVVTKTRLYDFRWPRGGMFVWVRMRFETHPLWGAAAAAAATATSSTTTTDTYSSSSSRRRTIDGVALCTALMIHLTHKPHRVIVSPGLMFSASDRIRRERGWAHYRLCFAAESTENVEACSRRLVDGIQRFWRIKKVKELEDLLDEVNAEKEEGRETEGLEMEMGNLASWMGC